MIRSFACLTTVIPRILFLAIERYAGLRSFAPGNAGLVGRPRVPWEVLAACTRILVESRGIVRGRGVTPLISSRRPPLPKKA